jgi:asparagine synthase (glutamine-hydrolysing)
MCGICGEFRAGGADRYRLRRMLEAIAHRGPDDEGEYVAGPIALGNRRLSIIDVPGGRQPVSNEDGTVRVVFNGEIYNHRELHEALEARGHRFRTQSDTEVLVHLYEELGDRLVDRLRGMFAFAIWDDPARKLLLARDRLGQKPLFYTEREGGLVFASEIKGILAVDDIPRRTDYESLHHYLSLRFIPPPRTMFEGVRKLPPGHLLVFQDGESRIRSYWHLSFGSKTAASESELTAQLDNRLRDAVRSHLVSDVPVGALLSGGMDSSVVVAFASAATEQPLTTFSIGVREQDFDELPFARMVADRYRTTHIEERVDIDVIGVLPRIIWHMDEPSDPIAACQFASAELASRHVKVVLGGDGGDEMFGGFDRYLGLQHVEHYARIPAFVRQILIAPVLRRMPDSFAYKNVTQKLRWAHRLAGFTSAAERYAEATCFFRFSHAEKRQLFGGDLWARLHGLDSSRVIVDQFERADSNDLVDRMLYADYTTRLPEHSLMLTDRMAMAHGLELRSPLLDHELVEFMARVPSRMKIRRGALKYILRRVAASRLPARIVSRPKQGFMFPVAYWFKHRLSGFLTRFWQDARIVQEGLVRAPYIQQMLDEHRRGVADHHVRLWMLLNVEVWHRLYMERQSQAEIAQALRACLRPAAEPSGRRVSPGPVRPTGVAERGARRQQSPPTETKVSQTGDLTVAPGALPATNAVND